MSGINAICVFDPKSSFNTSKISGTVKFHQCSISHNTIITVQLSGLGSNTKRGFHIHSQGDLTEGCTSLCTHWNPYNTLHGGSELYGDDIHAGDMGNLISDKDGNVNIIVENSLIDLSGPYSVVGRGVVIHEKEDDLGKYRDQDTKEGIESSKTGNAGKRVACSLIGVSNRNFHPEK